MNEPDIKRVVENVSVQLRKTEGENLDRLFEQASIMKKSASLPGTRLAWRLIEIIGAHVDREKWERALKDASEEYMDAIYYQGLNWTVLSNQLAQALADAVGGRDQSSGKIRYIDTGDVGEIRMRGVTVTPPDDKATPRLEDAALVEIAVGLVKSTFEDNPGITTEQIVMAMSAADMSGVKPELHEAFELGRRLMRTIDKHKESESRLGWIEGVEFALEHYHCDMYQSDGSGPGAGLNDRLSAVVALFLGQRKPHLVDPSHWAAKNLKQPPEPIYKPTGGWAPEMDNHPEIVGDAERVKDIMDRIPDGPGDPWEDGSAALTSEHAQMCADGPALERGARRERMNRMYLDEWGQKHYSVANAPQAVLQHRQLRDEPSR